MTRKKKSPYEGTEVDVDKSRAQIDRLLQEHGAEGVQWTTAWKQGKVHLRFVMRSPRTQKLVGFDVEPPAFKVKRKTWSPEKGRNIEVEEPNWPQAMRMLYYWLKAKLEAVTYGLREVEREFLNEMVVTTADGRETTVGELAQQQLQAGAMKLPMLEPPSEPVDADFTVR
jgi:hypothetical protein